MEEQILDWSWASSMDFEVPNIWCTRHEKYARLFAQRINGTIIKVSDGLVIKTTWGTMVTSDMYRAERLAARDQLGEKETDG